MKNDDIEYSLILTIVNRGYAELAVDAAREAGARGGTIIYARGTGVFDMAKFLNISILPEKEIVLTLVRKEDVRNVIHSILDVTGLRTKAAGISFTLPVTDFVGFSSQIGHLPYEDEDIKPDDKQK